MKEILIVHFICVFFHALLLPLHLTGQFHVHFPGNAEGLAESSEVPSILYLSYLF